MTTPKIQIPDKMDWGFLITFFAKLISNKPKIVAITEISIKPIRKTNKAGNWNYQAIVRGIAKDTAKSTASTFSLTLEHLEDCPWTKIQES